MPKQRTAPENPAERNAADPFSAASKAAAFPPLEDKAKPDTWWKWLLIYPTLAISIVSAVPTYVELAGSLWLGVPFGQYKVAMKENELWKDNVDCAAMPFDGLTNKNNVAVDAVVCQTGNVLVRVKPPEKKTAYRWVPIETVPMERSAFSLVRAAHAQPMAPIVVAQANFSVICQQWVGNGLIRRRIHNRMANMCFDEIVNTFNGQVVSTAPAPCQC